MNRTYRAAAGLLLAGCMAAPLQAATTEEKLEILADEVERLRAQVESGTGQAGSGKTTLGGYGELHYNRLKNKLDRSELNEVDFHRFVLFVGHRFTNTIRFHSEIELEHALVEDTDDGSGPGELELEQAYLEGDINDSLSVRGGVFLLPVGIINETHEPPTFYGVERNPVEKNIIPTTWWEAGVGATGRLGAGVSLDLAVHSGLKTVAANSYKPRDGRQKVAGADAHDGAATARIKWRGVRGLELAVSVQHQQDLTQGTESEAVSAGLYEAHVAVDRGPFGLRALYAAWRLDGDGPKAIGADKQNGHYIEPSFKITPKLGVFARYNLWDNKAGDDADSEYKQTDVGINYWPHENVVIKLDYQDQKVPDGKSEYDGYNLGIGYMF